MPLHSFKVDPKEAGERLDRLTARRLGTSRSTVQRIIQNRSLLVDGEAAVSSYRVRGGEHVEARLPGGGISPEEIPVPVVFEDEHLLVVD
jgi:23S rRNA pseudouridine1911/1915/1917 synthase